ncbi:hypothetical protein NM208_g6008 [Fusarium decemcellulare]|uniref:Uncharacterized protein n=1 Tax=Fusarium decemcellulare TaxID=57161 RepID=A0ACC1SEW4_9HYPO|nr:hypothetical protein NM208_g6008 [Fusarium decemcellulare]
MGLGMDPVSEPLVWPAVLPPGPKKRRSERVPWPPIKSLRSRASIPKGYDPAEEEERQRREEEERKQKEEEERLALEERNRKIREERERQRIERERQREKDQEAWRRASVVGGPSGPPGEARSTAGPPQQKAQFQFTNLDDLDDDDDDD